jgi:hypothetical protein
MGGIFNGTAELGDGNVVMVGKNAKRKLDIIVIRSCGGGSGITMSRPCFHCLQMMKTVNIRYCYYSTFEGVIVRERVRDMISIQMSNNVFKKMLHFETNKTEYYENLIGKTLKGYVDAGALDFFVRYNFTLIITGGIFEKQKNGQCRFYNAKGLLIASCCVIM